MSQDVLEVFKAIVVDENKKTSTPDMSLVDYGIVLDFTPTASQKRMLRAHYQKLNMRTLFSVEEREQSSPSELICKTALHYIEVYGLGMPGTFDLEFDGGTVVGITYIKGVTKAELSDMVTNLLYANAPVKDSEQIKRIIDTYGVDYDVNQIANNELKVALFDINNDTFNNGDDAVRYMCYLATGSAMLIKSKQVETAISDCTKINEKFLRNHAAVLAQVFNRHKRLIMAAKRYSTRSEINRISRWSKTRHVPVRESIAKSYVSKALSGQISSDVLNTISIRDKFKFLNLLAYKRQGNDTDAFVIRNGKIHVEPGRKVWTTRQIRTVETDVLLSLEKDLAHLKGNSILLDARVHYGLPISRKQVVGQLPFGTRVVGLDKGEVSSGIYWENEWGATDLDLSTITTSGQRTGWNTMNAFDNNNSVTFSGDITNAYDGAMEFMTSKSSSYGLFVNIFSGSVGCKTEVVVGTKAKSSWIEDIVIREKTTLDSRGSLVGFVKNRDFIVFQGRMSNNRVSSDKEASVVARATADFWTVNQLFDELGIDYDVEPTKDKEYTNELTYKGFAFDKLEELLLAD